MPVQDVAGFQTYWASSGNGPRDALFIHCSLAHGGAWGGVIKALKPGRYTTFDLPGHGRSGGWKNRSGFHRVSTEMACGLMENHTVTIGHSYGATVALRMAVERPELARALVLIEPVFFAAAARQMQVSDAHRTEHLALFNQIRAGKREAATKEFTRVWGTGEAWADIAPEQREYMIDRIHLIPKIDSQPFTDHAGILAGLSGINIPVLLIRGEKSPPIMSVVCDALAADIPNLQRVMIEGAGHLSPVTHPRQVAAAIDEILEMCGVDAGPAV